MDKNIPTLAYIKRQAKNIKKLKGITHLAALEFLSKEYGYSNWMHFQRALNQPATLQPSQPIVADISKLSFTDWLQKHKNRNSPLGDLGSDMLRDKGWPYYNSLDQYRDYLSFRGADYNVINALERAWRSHSIYLKRKPLSIEQLERNKQAAAKKVYPRKIVFVKGVTALHYSKRSIEKFNIGDPAWISWDGSKAIPVIITAVDDIYYTFYKERPLSKAGESNYLRLDEVRSTPELACINHVTW